MNDNHCPSYRLDSHRPHTNAQQADLVKLQERVKVLEAELASAFVLKENIKIEENIKVNLRRDESGYVWLTVDQGPTKAKGILNLGRQSWPENCSFFGQVLADVIGEGNGRDFWSNYEAKVIVADYVVRLKEAQSEVERLKAERAQWENDMLKELFIWADNWLPDEAKDQGARAVLQKVRAILSE